MQTAQTNLQSPPISETLHKCWDVYQEFPCINFYEGGFKSVVVSVFKQIVEFAGFQRIVWMSGEGIFGTEVAQICVKGGSVVMHKKASRSVKHHEAIIKCFFPLFWGGNFTKR
jgi:hypothetical protein